ncbi:MAG: thioredoxin-disulfide reductase [Candidatus Buchananbacteria bacterium CG10_big_fil_rev_8_21_14_0_10_42_9]|uniref:Thioredoxin-disulfide reductase n=1 Tax=Candidatus Buchananbacteria bacterium CG10_big_fil_rev_8_21_14_0_10_42_9 TaxID=1974526 RepID=A0A2H0W0J8_9BACT|nr:MAG: thioredoxin-disulfide reductase [Candidatus Buchananbacteria bacterium CG10_big_fil_rev_8_21_14_0_10_42_9]
MSEKKTIKRPEDCYDFLIIGAGVTGLSAGMYGARLGLRTLVLGANSESELAIGGVITLTDTVENYPGFIHLTGQELAKKIEDHARSYDNVEIKNERVTEVSKKGKKFKIVTDKDEYETKTLLFATGTKWRKLPMPGAKELENKGVAYCALCDGPLFKNKEVAIIGGSDSAAKESLFLAQHASKVYIVVRGVELKAEPINQKLVAQNSKIEVLLQTNVTEIIGEKFVEKIKLDKKYKGKDEIQLSGVFGAIGHIPLSGLAQSLGVELDEKKEIKINRNSETNIEGVYAAGDVVDTAFKQAIVGVAEGVVASYHAFKYVQAKEIEC